MAYYFNRKMSDEEYYLSLAKRPQRQNKFSKYRGVTKGTRNKPYRAVLVHKAIRHYLGNFDTEVEAARAYNEAALEIIGPYAVLNDIPDSETANQPQS